MTKRKQTPLQRDVEFVLDVAHDLPFMRRFLRRLVREAVRKANPPGRWHGVVKLEADRIAKEMVP